MWKPAPRLWIPKDKGRVSRQEVRHNRLAGVWCADEGCWLDDGTGDAPWERRKEETEHDGEGSNIGEKGSTGEEQKKGDNEKGMIDIPVETAAQVGKKVNGIWKGAEKHAAKMGKEAKKATGRVRPGRVRVRFRVEEGPMDEERWLF